MRISDWSSDVCSSDLGPEPFGGTFLNLLQTAKQVLSQPIIAYGSVVALDVGVLLRIAWLGMNQRDAPLGGPIQQSLADVLGTVVAADAGRLSTPLDNLIQRPRHALGRQAEVKLNAQHLTVEVIDHIEKSNAQSCSQLFVP